MKAGVNQNKCNGAGICVQLCPELFRFQEGSGKAAVILDEIPPRLFRDAREAERKCPARAVFLMED